MVQEGPVKFLFHCCRYCSKLVPETATAHLVAGLLALDGELGRLLVVETRMLRLNSRQTQLDGLLEETAEHRRPAEAQNDRHPISTFRVVPLSTDGLGCDIFSRIELSRGGKN